MRSLLGLLQLEPGEGGQSLRREPAACRLVGVIDHYHRVRGFRRRRFCKANGDASLRILRPEVVTIEVLRHVEDEVAEAILQSQLGGSPHHELLNAGRARVAVAAKLDLIAGRAQLGLGESACRAGGVVRGASGARRERERHGKGGKTWTEGASGYVHEGCHGSRMV